MNRILSPEEITRIREPLSRAWTLPPAAYTRPGIFDEEIVRIFRREWQCVARVDQIAKPGDYRCLTLAGQPIVVTRDRAGDIHAFSSICLHRAMPVAEGCGNATRFVCPYHHWTYELDGRLRSAPMMDGAEGFQAADCRLPTLRTEVWQGFVFANLDDRCEPLTPKLSGLAGLIHNYGFSDMVTVHTQDFDSPWNWKILVENFMEAYHHIGIHRQTFEPAYPARESFVEDNGDAPWTLLRMPGHRAGDAGALPSFPELTALQRQELIAACVFPTLLFGASGNSAAWYELLPTAHDRMTLRIHLLLRPEVADALTDEERAAVAEGIRFIHEEDIAANQGPWRGLHAPLTVQGRLSTFEKAIWQLNQLWAQRMALSP